MSKKIIKFILKSNNFLISKKLCWSINPKNQTSSPMRRASHFKQRKMIY